MEKQDNHTTVRPLVDAGKSTALFRASTNPGESQSKQMRLSNIHSHLHNITHPLTLPEPRQDTHQLDHARCMYASLSAGMHACLGFSSQLLMHFPDMTVAKKEKRKEGDFSSWYCIGLMHGQKRAVRRKTQRQASAANRKP